MKKIILFCSALILLSMTSCLKTYTCYCADNTTGASSTVTVKASNSVGAANACAKQTQGGTATCAY